MKSALKMTEPAIALRDRLRKNIDRLFEDARERALVLLPPFPAGPLILPTQQPIQTIWHEQFALNWMTDYKARALHAMALYLDTQSGKKHFLNTESGVATQTLVWAVRYCRLDIPEIHSLSLEMRLLIVKTIWERLTITSNQEYAEFADFVNKIEVSHQHVNGYKLRDPDVLDAYQNIGDPLAPISGTTRRSGKSAKPADAPIAVQIHMKSFQNEPDGEWIILGLLFFRLLHLKLGLHLTNQIRPSSPSSKIFYPGLLNILNRCALEATHRLAPVAGALELVLSRFCPFYSTGSGVEPRAITLPDALRLDSLSSGQSSTAVTKCWLLHLEMDYAETWVDDVSSLAHELATTYTDPYGQLAFSPLDPKSMLKFHVEQFEAFRRVVQQHSQGEALKTNVLRVQSNVGAPPYFDAMDQLLKHGTALTAPIRWVVKQGLDDDIGYQAARIHAKQGVHA